jgi:hypothetical protein
MTDIYLQRGEYSMQRMTVTRSGVALDITGATVVMAIRNTGYAAGTVVADTAAFLTKSVGSGITLTDPTNGIMDIEFTKTDTNSIEFTTTTKEVEMIYGIEIIPAGFTTSIPVLSGRLIITPDVVRGI